VTLEELEAYGLKEMSDDEIEAFLRTQGMGVLGLPDSDAPYMLPMSFGYDGGDTLYFTFLVGSDSRKADLTENGQPARFLVYSVDTVFNWESVSLAGALHEVPGDEWDALEDVLHRAWRPAILEEATLEGAIKLYEFDVSEKMGIKHTGLPPGFDFEPDEA
jgi:hypothetical protein